MKTRFNKRDFQFTACFLPSLLSLACAQTPEESQASGESEATQSFLECDFESLIPCDILTRDCQKSVFDAVTCLRGNADAEMPNVIPTTSKDYSAQLTSYFETQPESAIQAERAYQLLGLLPEGVSPTESVIDAKIDFVDAHYNGQNDTVFIIEDDCECDSDRSTALLAHEFVHALQNAAFGLEAFRKSYVESTDSYLAIESLIEGEAELYQALVYFAVNGKRPSEKTFDEHWGYEIGTTLSRAADPSLPVVLAFLDFPYTFGEQYISNAWMESGSELIEQLFEDPALTSLEYFYSLFTVSSRTMDPDPDAENLAFAIPEDYRVVFGDTLGMFALWAFLARLKISIRRSNTIDDTAWEADQWRSDLLVVASDEDDQTVLAWKICWDSNDAAQLFVDSVESIKGIAGGVWRVTRGKLSEMDLDQGPGLMTTLYAAETEVSLDQWVRSVSDTDYEISDPY